jgi:hypothetical protein
VHAGVASGRDGRSVTIVRTADAMRACLRDTDPVLERDALGTGDLDLVAKSLEECCARTLAPVEDCLFYHSSTGMVVGLVLTDGRPVVAKVHHRDQTRARLATVQRMQAHLADAGYPCPRPLGMAHCEHAFVTFEELREDGIHRDGHEAPVRRAMARALAEQIRLTGEIVEVRALTCEPLRERRVLWRETDHPMFDFDASRQGAEWIDELAGRALDVLRDDPGAIVVGHIDWRVEQMRFAHGRVSVVYDWDSLVRDSETTIIGPSRSPGNAAVPGSGRPRTSRPRSSPSTSRRAAGRSAPRSGERWRRPGSTSRRTEPGASTPSPNPASRCRKTASGPVSPPTAPPCSTCSTRSLDP